MLAGRPAALPCPYPFAFAGLFFLCADVHDVAVFRLTLLVLLLMACDGAPAPAPAASAAPSASALTIFDEDYAFTCSSEKIACDGVLKPYATPSQGAILETGQDAFRARVATLKAAKKSIRVQALIFRADESGLHISELLKAKKKEGLDVRVIVDATSNLDWKTQWMYWDLQQNGIGVEGYEALYLQWAVGELKPLDPLRVNKRFHDKMWVVDAEDEEAGVAIVGGLNIANEYFRIDDTPINKWTDQDVVLRGRVVSDVAAVFDRNHDYFKSIKKGRHAFNPDNAWKLKQATLDKLIKIKAPTWPNKELVASIDEILKTEAKLSLSPIEGRFLQSRPRLKETYIRQAYLDMIDRAKETVLIVNAYFVPSRKMIKHFNAAAARGVRVVIITNSPETNDIRPVALVSRYIYKDLLDVNKAEGTKGTLEIHEWAGAPHDEGTLHAKFAVVDRKEAIVGSYNLDPRSDQLNSETAIALRGTALTAWLEDHVLKQLLPKSTAISWDDAKRFRKPKGMKKKFELLFALKLEKWL
jgi:putative cardiolipin synthase